jgi:hypothetical protein
MNEVQPLDSYDSRARPWIFLAGSIDGGKAPRWQDRVVAALADHSGTLLNPRRDDWNDDWKEDVSDRKFRGQVEWEIKGLESADLVLMYFEAESRSPITLLELGLVARSRKVVVCCPPGYWKKGNVDLVCLRYGVAQVDSLDALVAHARERMSSR